jgi:hypothetical protein
MRGLKPLDARTDPEPNSTGGKNKKNIGHYIDLLIQYFSYISY